MSNTHNATGLYNPDGSVTFYGSMGGSGGDETYYFETKSEMDAAIQAGEVPTGAICIVNEDTPYVVKAEAVVYGESNVKDELDELNSNLGTRSKRLYEGFLSSGSSANVTIPSGGNYLVIAGDLNATAYKMNAWLVSVLGTPSNGRHTIFKFVDEAQKATISFSSNTNLVLSTSDANGTEFTVTQL